MKPTLAHRAGFASLLSTLAIAVGCGGPANARLDGYASAALDSPANLSRFLFADARALGGSVQALLNLANPPAGTTCPMLTVSGNTRTLIGGCTDAMGRTWGGSLTLVTDDAAGRRTLTLDRFDIPASMTCGTTPLVTHRVISGRIVMTQTPLRDDFDIDVVTDYDEVNTMTCAVAPSTSAIRYAGSATRTSTAMNAATTWNGSGRVGSSPVGVASVATANEVTDVAACQHEPASGLFRVSSGPNTAEITYDGATTCTTPPVATWTFNAMPRGNIQIGCNARPGHTPGGEAAIALSLATLALVSRRSRIRRARHGQNMQHDRHARE